MRRPKDKDFGWLITFASFLVFLLAAVTSAASGAAPASAPEAVVLANAPLQSAYISVVPSFIRYAALCGVLYGVAGILHGRRETAGPASLSTTLPS